MPTKTKTKQTLDIKSVDTPSDLVSQNTLFDYSNYSEEFKLKSYERKARIKANEQVATKAFYDIAQDVKAQHDEMNNYQDWLNWCRLELEYTDDSMAKRLLMIGNQLGDHDPLKLPKTYRGLLTLARALNTSDEETKDKILEQVEAKTEEKGKALTEKEIKEITAPYLEQIKALQEQVNEAKQGELFFQQKLDKKIDDYNDLQDSYSQKVNELASYQETINNQNKQIKELNSAISAKENELQSLENDRLDLVTREQELDDLIAKEANVLAQQTLEQERKALLKKEADLKAQEEKLRQELKQAESLKRTVERQKDNLDTTTEWINNFSLTNDYLMDVVSEMKKHKNALYKSPDLTQLSEDDKAYLNNKIKDLIVDFNTCLHELGGQINSLNGAVAKFNNHALRVLDAKVEVTNE